MLFEIKPKMGCIYVAEVLRSDGTVIKRSGESPNLLTQYGLDVLNGANSNNHTNLIVGTGTNPPSLSDTALTNPSAPVGATTYSSRYDRTGTIHYIETAVTYTFAQGAVVGNITEVGLIYNSSVVSLALFLDGSGIPTAITVLSDEILRVIVLARVYESPVQQGVLSILNGSNAVIDEIPYETNVFITTTASSHKNLRFNRTLNNGGIMGSTVAMTGVRDSGNGYLATSGTSSYNATYPVVDDVRRLRITNNYPIGQGNGVWRGFSGSIVGLLDTGNDFKYRVAFLDGKSFTKTSSQLLTLTVDIIASDAT